MALFPTPRNWQPSPGTVTVAADFSTVAFRIDPQAPWAAHLPPDSRPEAYHLQLTPTGVTVTALTPEGLLRARATLQQLSVPSPGGLALPCGELTDGPTFRYRCAADWLLNCEINRWGYDWGDGPAAYRERIKRKLDFCFAHKINQVWFDGLGWDLNRIPGYAEMMRDFNRYARARGLRLTFAGYGGGYGTSYQKSELYRCGYQGQTLLNRDPWPDGPEYECRGCDHYAISRRYGTCWSNAGLAGAKLDELAAFVSAVEPGFLYLHDVDTGTYDASRLSWLQRCDHCRQRWPSDEMASPEGAAGGLAHWLGQLCDRLQTIRTDDGYDAARDLGLIFTSPVYGLPTEPGQPELWETEIAYFRAVSEALGPRPEVHFGLREQFLTAHGEPKIARLRAALEAVGNGHQLHVISFGGGDHYRSADLCSLTSLAAHLYRGARSVCLSTGGVHEEAVQVLNAECLWHGSARGFRAEPADDAAALELWSRLERGEYRPEEIMGPQGLLEEICEHLWGPAAGPLMFAALSAGPDGRRGPISRVWWSITREIRRFRGEPLDGEPWPAVAADWQARVAATARAAHLAAQAAQGSADEDLLWFARCLQVGLRFAEIIAQAAAERAGQANPAEAPTLTQRLEALDQWLQAEFTLIPTDLLGGDPGCWQDTLRHLREVLAAG
jgi:hypothetical protein